VFWIGVNYDVYAFCDYNYFDNYLDNYLFLDDDIIYFLYEGRAVDSSTNCTYKL